MTIKIGTLLRLEIFNQNSNKTEKCHCKVIEKNKNFLFIDYPINQSTKKTVFLSKGKTVSITYVDDDKAVYFFKTEIAARLKMTVPALAFELPKKEHVKRIQRREFVRVETAIDAAIHSQDHSFSPFTTVTTDLSGGGASVIVSAKNVLEVGTTVNVWLALQLLSGEYHYIYAEAEIVLIKSTDHSIKTASLKFNSITKQAQQHIIRYCFEKQREARKKELI